MIRPGLSWGTPPPPAAASSSPVNDRYLGEQVASATPAELTDMLFTEALRRIDTAIELFKVDDFATALPHVVKAQQIVTELRTSLRPEGGEISVTLESIYQWVYKQLVDANLQRNHRCLTEARNCLAPIAEAWATAVLGR